jgi:hypothetical protein
VVLLVVLVVVVVVVVTVLNFGGYVVDVVVSGIPFEGTVGLN